MTEDERLAEELASLRIPRRSENHRQVVAKDGSGRRSSVPAWLIGGGVLVLLLVGGFLLAREGRGRLIATEVELGQVSLLSPQQADVTLVATGYVQARQKATVAPKTTGRLAKLLVDENSEIKSGQLVAELESADAIAQLAQVTADIAAAKAKVERAAADVEDAKIKFERESSLLKSGAGTQSAFDDAKLRLVAAKAQLSAGSADEHAVEARREAVRVLIENTKVRAPFSGTVIRKLAEPGEVIAVGGMTGAGTPTGIVFMAALDTLQVEADVSESQIGKVKIGAPAEILLDAFPDRRFRGEVGDIRSTVDRAKAAVTVKVRFTDHPKGVVPEMAAKVSFLDKALDDAALKAKPKLVVPSDAVVNRDGRQVLLSLDEGQVRELPVQSGISEGQFTELVNGPATGTRVIRHPDASLKAGSAVKEKSK